MKFSLHFRKAAHQELNEAIAWYEDQKVGLGYEFAARVEKSLELLKQNPELFSPVLGEIRKKR